MIDQSQYNKSENKKPFVLLIGILIEKIDSDTSLIIVNHFSEIIISHSAEFK